MTGLPDSIDFLPIDDTNPLLQPQPGTTPALRTTAVLAAISKTLDSFDNQALLSVKPDAAALIELIQEGTIHYDRATKTVSLKSQTLSEEA